MNSKSLSLVLGLSLIAVGFLPKPAQALMPCSSCAHLIETCLAEGHDQAYCDELAAKYQLSVCRGCPVGESGAHVAAVKSKPVKPVLIARATVATLASR